MRPNRQDFGSEADLRRYKALLRGEIVEVWERCLPVWSAKGRVTDRPKGVRSPQYKPSFECILGHFFVERFADEYLFLLDRLYHGSKFESACAFELLDFLAEYLREINQPLPDALRACESPVPQQIRTEIEMDRAYRNQGLDTVGKLLEFEYNGQSPAR